MAEINHFEYGWITPALSYALSVLGSILGLVCAGRIRTATSSGQRVWWGLLAAWAIGGTAIWAMHFMAMLGLRRREHPDPLRRPAHRGQHGDRRGGGRDRPGHRGHRPVERGAELIAGGIFTGAGVAVHALHGHGGDAAQRQPRLRHASGSCLSVVIAVVASTVALWLAMTVRRGLAIFASALVMGVAVNGMHFTGMSALSVHRHERRG